MHSKPRRQAPRWAATFLRPHCMHDTAQLTRVPCFFPPPPPISTSSKDAHILAGDLADQSHAKAVIDTAVEKMGGIDILHLNHVVSAAGPPLPLLSLPVSHGGPLTAPSDWLLGPLA